MIMQAQRRKNMFILVNFLIAVMLFSVAMLLSQSNGESIFIIPDFKMDAVKDYEAEERKIS